MLTAEAAIEFETERLRLRQWRTTDRGPFAALNADPEVMAFFPSPLSRAASDALAARCAALIEARGWGFWACELKRTGEFIGFVGLHEPPAALPLSPCVEIGWRLALPFWGQGYASEAARGALAVGFEQLALSEIVSFTATINIRSRAVMSRLGMRQTGQFMHPSLADGSPLRAHCWYRLSIAQWHAQGLRPRRK
ncbi:GNAT family N-acetyltransferase [Denitromonas halophila]|uniref:GNAT family N-acetyltransferase n=1 Tax=Denitromonas halophila TaxID=1629404 RepID=A0A557QKN7_9RHOO|nr:GNAT family N-acetyltransferase [Denitromonas halophila]TVO53475.1 GNAT family N-acetyltransferase [Denitromonas halophila]